MSRIVADIAVIGGGSGGLSVAAGAAQMGALVVLVEKHKMGGDCLNTGCVPSKALIAAADAAQTVRESGKFGVNGHEPCIDFVRVKGHVHGTIARIAPHDSVERFTGLGVRVIEASASFVSPTLLIAGPHEIEARRFVISTGSSAFVPPILTWPFADNDRAQAECATEGFIKVVVSRKGTIIGATIVGRHAGELILPWVLAVKKKLTVGDMASIIAPYPTLSEDSKRVAGAWYTPKLFSERTRRIVGWMQRLP